ncbi:type I-E CRISPR-associated protein Cse2/CasB [Acetobacter senegalensis]|uniref:type I-E CRISPR-associated protein Cse2/CasB n=1 Tax=Acetobacter senegalensis TaxID=446692 RepID=UPI001EDE2DFE|nr:type I-E CRISPR-associated protein Cse2/CasB [Acetobacter senegalensis]MCG4274598.1 type I-E CRISPR-associated protein Cse2/CasB [Acetobacter senegalensis]
MLIGDKETVRQVVNWWHGLQPNPEKKQPGDRAALARLRRCTSVTEALFEQETQALVRKCGARWDSELSRLALAASVLAHVRADKAGVSMARQIGPVDTNDDATALCKPVRFRRVLDAETYDDCLRVFRRLVVLAGGAVDVADLARSVMMWPREDAPDDLVGDQIRRKWVYDYWNAGTPDAAFDKKN